MVLKPVDSRHARLLGCIHLSLLLLLLQLLRLLLRLQLLLSQLSLHLSLLLLKLFLGNNLRAGPRRLTLLRPRSAALLLLLRHRRGLLPPTVIVRRRRGAGPGLSGLCGSRRGLARGHQTPRAAGFRRRNRTWGQHASSARGSSTVAVVRTRRGAVWHWHVGFFTVLGGAYRARVRAQRGRRTALRWLC